MTFNTGGLSAHYASERGQFGTLDGAFTVFIVREATLTLDMDAIESRYLREVRIQKYAADSPVLHLNKEQVTNLRDFLTGVIADIEGDEQL